ncbi:hypothetical protein Sfulv_37750 [Streptomyces fulvorobeus]|uniref:RNA polymerase sigma-70 region 2 domain-containing protein n=1 Tax=Streptomyces fulvorobeus TaxID=284028 RepID=A0A7J0CAZ9_9ACTN|nr:hypothetical protein Sfulv_37750 [Streptomyces fulvorobeus]
MLIRAEWRSSGDQLRFMTAGRVEGVLGDDAELTAAVLAAQDGDEDAFRAVYRAVQPRLLGYIRTLVGDADAEDVASESWLQIARDLDRFGGDADRFRGWAARIARNRCLDHLRMRSRRPAIGGDETELTGKPAESDTADEAIEALATARAMSYIAQLPRTRPRPSSCGWWSASTRRARRGRSASAPAPYAPLPTGGSSGSPSWSVRTVGSWTTVPGARNRAPRTRTALARGARSSELYPRSARPATVWRLPPGVPTV